MPAKESFDIDGLMVFRSDLTAVDQDGNIVAGVITPDRYFPSDREPLSDVQIGRYTNTTAYWNAHATYIPKKGEVIVYSDGETYERNGQIVTAPLMKIGTGNEYLGQLPFYGQVTIEKLDQHIADNTRHINTGERDRWNSKLNISPDPSVHYVDETLIFNRD